MRTVKKVPIAQLKANASSLIAGLRKSQRSYLITVRGEPVAELRALPKQRQPVVLGGLAHTGKILGNIVTAEPDDAIYREPDGLFGANS